MAGGAGLKNIASAFASMPNKDVIDGKLDDNTLGHIIGATQANKLVRYNNANIARQARPSRLPAILGEAVADKNKYRMWNDLYKFVYFIDPS